MERRGQRYHRERLGGAIREEIETILGGELADPRIGLIGVTAVVLAADSRSARVMVESTGNEDEVARSMEGLKAATGFIRHELGERLQLRHPPDLYFQLDNSQKHKARVDELLERTKKRAR